MVKKLEMIYEGKAKKVYSTDDPDLVLSRNIKTTRRPLTERKRGKLWVRAR